MKHLLTPRKGRILLMCCLAVVFTLPCLAQDDNNPNQDHIPAWFFMHRTPGPKLPLSSTITVGNYDNFNLAVDFGESNMAENMQTPAHYFTAYNTNSAHHTEDGYNWTDVSPNFNQTMQGDPVVAYDSLGNIFYQNMYGASSILGAMVIKSTDNGNTWGTAVTAIAGVDKNWMACDQTNGPYANYIYCTMTNSSTGNFTRSTDHGATFTSTFTPNTQSLPGMMVCVGPNGNTQGGNVYVVTNSGSSFASTYTFYHSTDGGTTFTQMSAQNFSGYVGTNVNSRNSVQNMRTRPYPMIAADNSFGTHRGRLYCVYASNNPPGDGNKPDIWCRWSDNNGTTWSSAVMVNDDANPTTHHQWHPAIWCDKQTGRLYCMWMDTRDCPTSDSALIYASYSDNGGASWVTNQAISNQKMKIDCATCGGGGTPRYQGDYNGIISNKKCSMVGWTDFRQGSFMSATAYFPDFAMSINHNSDTLVATSDSADFIISIPSVKLYSDTVLLTASVNPVPTQGSISFIYLNGTTVTTFPASRTVRVKLSGNVPGGNYSVIFTCKGPNGTPVHQRAAAVLVQAALGVAVTANPSTVCTGSSTQLSANASGGQPPYTYSWTSNPPGFTSGIANPTASPTVNTWYRCTVTDLASHTKKDSVYVTISSLPATPGSITGSTSPCEGSSQAYSIAAVTGATTYTWSVPSGSTIQSGQGTTSVSMLIGGQPGSISVTAGNTCGNSPASTLTLNVSPLPATPGPVNGPTTVCSDSAVSYNVAQVAGLTYNWTVPPDATITGGQGTSSISVHWGISSGNVSVAAQNTCGSSPYSSISVTAQSVPGPAQAVSGPDSVCRGMGGYNYGIPAIAGSTSYVWILPNGAQITQGQGTNNITVAFGSSAVSGDISAAGINSCGTGTAGTKAVKVLICTGTEQAPLQSEVVIYPNPARGTINISLKGKEKQLMVRISDMSGKTLLERSFENLPEECTRQLDISGLSKGLYLISLSGGSGIYTGKISVE